MRQVLDEKFKPLHLGTYDFFLPNERTRVVIRKVYERHMETRMYRLECESGVKKDV